MTLNIKSFSTHTRVREENSINNIPENPVSKKVEYLLSQSKPGQSDYLTKKGLTFELPLLDGGKIFVPLMNVQGEYTGTQFIESNGSKHLMRGTHKKGAFITISSKNGKSYLQGVEDFPYITTRAREVIICEGLATGVTLTRTRVKIKQSKRLR